MEKSDEIEALLSEIQQLKLENTALLKNLDEFKSVQGWLRCLNAQPLLGVFIFQNDKPVFLNETIWTLFGYPKEALKSYDINSLANAIHPLDRAKVLEQLRKKLSDNKDIIPQYEFRILTMSGEMKWVSLYSSHIIYKGGDAVLGVILDISQKKRYEEALSFSEERYRRLAELTKDMIIVHDLEGRITYINHAFEELVGRSKDDVLDHHINEFLDPYKPEVVQKRRELRLQGDQGVFLYEADIINCKGEFIPVEVCSTIFLENNVTKGIILSARDIRERKQALRSLVESESRYRTLFDASTDAIFLESVEGQILDCNQAACDLYGYSREEMVKLTVKDVVPPKFVKMIPEIVAKHQHGDCIFMEAEGVRKNGQIFPTEVSTKLINLSGNPVVIVFVKDITSRKMAEDALRKSEMKYRHFFDNAQVGLIRVTVGDGTIVDVNDRLAEMFGFSREELIGKHKTLEFYFDLNDRDKIRDELQKKGAVRNFEAKFSKRDGNVIWIRMNVWTVPEEDVIEGVLTDITEQKEAELALRESERNYRHLIENSNDAIYLLDQNRFEVINQKFSQLLGVTPEEVRAPDFNLMDLVAPHSRPLIDERTRMLQQGIHPPLRYEFTGMSKDGRFIEFETSISYIEHEGRTLTQGILRDITEKKKLEEQFLQSQKMEAVGRLAGGIAHDFNNLLTAILGHIELMELKFKSGDPLFKDVEVIHKAAERAAALTGQLLAFSRKQALLPKVLNLNSLIEDLNKILRRVIGEDIEFKSILYPNLPNVKVDPNQMEMVIMNLVINARDAMSSADKLTIETGLVDLDKDYCSTHTDVTPGKYVSLAVSDTGVGMPPEVMEKAFEPFFTTKEVGKGTGLGLSTVHGIVKQSGGNVTIYSEVGKGTTVTIYLPITSDDTDGKMGAGGLPPLPMGNETILLVEDEESVRSMTANALVKQGFQVLTADNGVNAVLLVEKINPQIEILVTDIVMPKMNGKQLWNCLKEKYPQLKVLFMSGYTANAVSEIEVKDIQLPFIQKPFKSSDLVRKVRKVLDS